MADRETTEQAVSRIAGKYAASRARLPNGDISDREILTVAFEAALREMAAWAYRDALAIAENCENQVATAGAMLYGIRIVEAALECKAKELTR